MKNVLSNVVMLPTEKAKHSNLFKLPYTNNISNKFVPNCKPQHLYFTTDEEIKVGDWILADGYNNMHPKHLGIAKADKEQLSAILQGFTAKKIVASTDESLGLPRPSNEFLNKFCEVGGIWEVLVEYEQTHWKGTKLSYEDKFKLKVAPDNTITIHPVKQKESWSREEIEIMVKEALDNISMNELRLGTIDLRKFLSFIK